MVHVRRVARTCDQARRPPSGGMNVLARGSAVSERGDIWPISGSEDWGMARVFSMLALELSLAMVWRVGGTTAAGRSMRLSKTMFGVEHTEGLSNHWTEATRSWS